MDKNSKIIIATLSVIAALSAYKFFTKKSSIPPGPEPSQALWKVGDILLLTSGEKWEILKVYSGTPIVYQAKWLDVGNIADVPEANFVAAGATIYNPPEKVTVTLKNMSAPAGATYWCVFCKWYESPPFTPIANAITWSNIPPDTPIYNGPSGSWGIMVTVYDVNQNLISAINTNSGLGFSNNFNEGWIYTWDFARGLWLQPTGAFL